jgi:hypothetical protein
MHPSCAEKRSTNVLTIFVARHVSRTDPALTT